MGINGNGKTALTIALIIFEVIIVSIILFMGNKTIDAYNLLTRQDRVLEEKFYVLKDISNDCLHKIDLRLSRIEHKLGV